MGNTFLAFVPQQTGPFSNSPQSHFFESLNRLRQDGFKIDDEAPHHPSRLLQIQCNAEQKQFGKIGGLLESLCYTAS